MQSTSPVTRSRVISIMDITQEARRNAEVCNSCRYCEGFCAVFPAIERQREFDDNYIDYLSNLCHNCTSCYHACQFTAPHVYDINVPRIMTQVRAKTYQKFVWPSFMSDVFQRNGTFVALISALIFSLVLIIGILFTDPSALFAKQVGEGAFYRVISHEAMVLVAGSVVLFDVLAILLGFRAYWRWIGGKTAYFFNLKALHHALKDALTLKHLGGGEDMKGCNHENTSFSNQRRWYHHLMMYGFLLCFGATVTGTIYDYGFGWVAPYDYISLPVFLGTVGGVMTLVGTTGLVWLKLKMHDGPAWKAIFGMDYAFLVLLFWVNLTGLALLAFRETTAMGMLLIIHLGFVAAFFAILPYSKFVHVLFRLGSLIKYHNEAR
ncbi:tricarballylate utilization 4Fe-4S protein TcuB [Paenalcaligenes faecalis]|uniref:tricarballylate utilization 4Fe-4S protein TcuB n=1 Tax=Paenalcaligenes faecalis TaxID=2980099 RepID=UPI0022B99ACA|nr:tricarballylate utilization 4Fe-4S protein TcuB [Paenalcaligenes faecalis]